ncbi:MAG TPA: DUF2244 domain-containing protein [Albidovulum sp.]|uniref:DUF2244 domain-containing protein n=1 Tax=Albidovulum sp. TaxID=1872424 RepID=UPI002D030BCE|nr:DUF2244 domain-containing protein [Albidovulum sp.]
MPYEWTDTSPDGQTRLALWPYRSLPARGFVLFIAATSLMMLMPLLVLLGTRHLWVILPFALVPVAGIWWAVRRNNRDAALTEVLTIGPESITLVRRAPDGKEQTWQANPYWATIHLYPTGGPVPAYLTLKGDGREVELGAFLSEEERRRLAEELRQRLAQLR